MDSYLRTDLIVLVLAAVAYGAVRYYKGKKAKPIPPPDGKER